jgi:integrase
MSRPLNVPSYRLHKQSGQAIVTLTDALGRRRDVLLGRHGTAESRTQYARVIAEWETSSRRIQVPGTASGSVLINELILAFWCHAEQHYRREDGTHTNELNDYRLSLKPLSELYGTLPVNDFGPLKLKAVRQRMADARKFVVRFKAEEKTLERRVWQDGFRQAESGVNQVRWLGKWYDAELVAERMALSRGVINQRVGRIVRMFKWGVAEEMVPESIWNALTTVGGLERGRSGARETSPVKPVSEADVYAVLPHLLPQTQAMVKLQLLTGMRPGEACLMRACDIDMTGTIWLYRPVHHKTHHKGKERVVAIGPKAQEVIRPFLKLETQAYLFSPKDAMEWRRQRKREARKSKVQPSQVCRKRNRPKTLPGERYRTVNYAQAVARACKAAGVVHFHPHQIRHTHATEVRRLFGLEAAQVALGHAQAQITQIYAERDLALAAKVAQQIG